MEIKTPERIIMFNGQKLADLNPTLSVSAIVKMHAATNAQLATAIVEGPEYKNGEAHYNVNTRIGTKA